MFWIVKKKKGLHQKNANTINYTYNEKLRSEKRDCILRSIDSFGTAHTVLETISPQTGDIIVNNFHPLTLKACVCIQVELMIRAVLERKIERL